MSLKHKHPFGRMGYEIKRDVHNRDMDAKILITSHNSRPGLGKTTLAIKMARELDPHGWNAEEKAFMDAHEYHQAYDDLEPGSVMIFDELEDQADSRRAMSSRNVELSQAWAQNRYRNMITIATLPSVSMLDKRMEELSDYWINVIDRGVAHPYWIRVNDFSGQIIRQRMDDGTAAIRYSDLPQDDADYVALKEEKHDRRMSIDKKYYSADEHQKEVKKAREKAQMVCRNKWIKSLCDDTDLTPYDLNDLDILDISRQRIDQIWRS